MDSKGNFAMSREAKRRRKAFQDYADGKIDELKLAKKLGFPTETEAEKVDAIQRIRDMTTGGRDHTFSTKEPGRPPLPFTGGTGVFIDNTTVTSGGKTQIPAAIRNKWQLNDGDKIYWFEKNGDIIIVPSTPWREGKLR